MLPHADVGDHCFRMDLIQIQSEANKFDTREIRNRAARCVTVRRMGSSEQSGVLNWQSVRSEEVDR